MFFYLKKKMFQEIKPEIDTAGTYLNSYMG